MGIAFKLSSLALRPLLNGVSEALGAKALVASGEVVVGYLTERFTDHSQRLASALQGANDNSWKALEVALLGDTLWDKCKAAVARGEDSSFGRQLRLFLDAAPLPELAGKTEFRKQCLKELRGARTAGVLTGKAFDPQELARQAGTFAQFSDPQNLLDAEWQAVAGVAGVLKEAGYPSLAWLLAQKSAQGLPLLVLAVRYFFRRALEEDTKLFQGLAFAKIEALQGTQDAGFAGLASALAESGQRLEQLLADVQVVVVETHGAVLDLQQQLRGQSGQIQQLGQAVLKMLDQYQLQRRELRPTDSLSIRNDGERQLVKDLVKRYRALPGDEQTRLPALLNGLGKLEVVVGDFDAAQRDFQKVAALVPESAAKAEAHHSAYRAALERRDSAAAIVQLIAAVRIDGKRYAPFPVGKYHPLRILGAGGFGVAFLCKHKQLQKEVVVKALSGDGLEREFDQMFDEARALHDLEHPGIIRLLDCGYTFPTAKSRPYFVMHHFDGLTLEQHVDKHGPLPLADALTVARLMADALQAAHAKGILHRDIKPANVLVAHDAAAAQAGKTPAWQVKLIDFGLAIRHAAAHSTAQATSGRTLVASSIAGTVDYAAPEQMGRLPGVAIGPYSDVYGFARTCCYALFKQPHPRRQHWNSIPEPVAEFLDACLAERPEERPASFTLVLERLTVPASVAPTSMPRMVVPAPTAPPLAAPAMPAWTDSAAQVVSDAAKPLVENLTSPDGAKRREAADKLRELGDLSAVPALMRRVADDVWIHNDPHGGGKMAALAALRTLAPDKKSEALVAALQAKSEQARAWACAYLEGEHDPLSAARLIATLNDRAPAVRIAAADTLGKNKEASACEALARLLSDRRDDTVRVAAVRALEQIEETPIECLTQALQDTYGEVRRLAAEALKKRGDEAAVPALVQRVADNVWLGTGAGNSSHNDPHAGGKLAALTALRALGPERASEALVGALQAKSEYVRAWACAYLAHEHDQPSAAKLIDALSDRVPAVRIAAAGTLGQRKEASACAELVRLLADRREESVRVAAIRALNLIDEAPVEALMQALKDTCGEVRRVAAETLKKRGDEAAVPALVQRVADDLWIFTGLSDSNQNDPHAGGKEAALNALRALAPDRLSEALSGTLQSKAEQARVWACNHLAREHDEPSAARLVAALSDRMPLVRIAAATALGQRKEATACAALVGLLSDRRDDNVRVAAVRALDQIDEAPVEPLIQALKDTCGTVRRFAAEALGRRGDERAAPALVQRVAEDLWIFTGSSDSNQNDPHAGGKEAALNALRKVAPDKVPVALLAALKSKTEYVREWACRWSARETDDATRAALEAAVSDRSPLVKAAATRALVDRKDGNQRR